MSGIIESLLQKSFDRVWDDLDEDASKIKQPITALPPPRKPESMIEEILSIVRSLQRANQEENDLTKAQHEAIQTPIRRGLAGAITTNSLNLGGLTPIQGGDHSEKTVQENQTVNAKRILATGAKVTFKKSVTRCDKLNLRVLASPGELLHSATHFSRRPKPEVVGSTPTI